MRIIRKRLPVSILNGLCLWAAAGTLSACSGKTIRSEAFPSSGYSRVFESSADPAGARIGTFVSSERGFVTSSYWIEGPTGLILVDTQFLPSEAKEFVDLAERLTGKKAELAIVLHPNPDKFNGTLELQKRGIRVVTSEQVRSLIPAVHELRTKWFFDRYKPDYPVPVPLPESFGSRTTELSAGGLKVKAHVLNGAGCSDAHVVVEYEGHVFPGDLVTNGFHSWLELGRLTEWRSRLEEIRALRPARVHPGRGPSAGPGLLIQQDHYLAEVVRMIREAKRRVREPAEADFERLAKRVYEAFPGLRYGLFVEKGLEAAWKR